MSLAVTVTETAPPAKALAGALTLKPTAVAGLTSKAPLVPDLPLTGSVAVTVLPAPAPVTIALPVQMPLRKAAEAAGVIVPDVVLRFTVPLKAVTVLFPASCAVIVMLKGAPAVWGLLSAAMPKWSREPGATLKDWSEGKAA